MFERFTEKARRVIFFARYEASQWGAQSIQPEHLLLGLLREDKALFSKLPCGRIEDAEKQMGLETGREKTSTSVDLPLAPGAQQVLAFAVEETDTLRNEPTGTIHLLIGLLRQPGAACKLLEEHGVQLAALRQMLLSPAPVPLAPPSSQRIIGILRREFGAMTGRLTPEVEPAVLFSLRTEVSK